MNTHPMMNTRPMSRNYVMTIASVSGILGMMMGVLLTAGAWLQTDISFARAGGMAKAEASINSKVELLERLRQGHYAEATRQLESWLDADIEHAAAEFSRDGTELSPAVLQAIEAERKARALSSYNPAASSYNPAASPTEETSGSSSRLQFGERTTSGAPRIDEH